MAKPKELFLVWQDGADEQYFNQYYNLLDAVTSEPEPCEVYKANVNYLGHFKSAVKVLKAKKARAKKASKVS